MKKKLLWLAAVTMLSMTSCTDDLGLRQWFQEDDLLQFTAGMAEQNWYGSVSVNKSRATAAFDDEDIDDDRMLNTNLTDRKGRPLMIQAHTLEGIKTERVKMGSAEPATRAQVTTSIDARNMSISQVGTTYANNTTKIISIVNKQARTKDGVTWSCNEFFANSYDYYGERFFGALFPYSDDYKVLTDNTPKPNAPIATNAWMTCFRLDYELKEDSAQNQIDVLYAKHHEVFDNSKNATDKTLPLAFRHAMTAVKVKLGKRGFAPAVIKEIRLSGYRKKGTFHFFQEVKQGETYKDVLNQPGWWETSGTADGHSVSVVNFDTQGEYNCYVTGDAATFMMIPQKLPNGAKMEIDIVFAAKPKYEQSDITDEWDPDVWDPDAEEEEAEEEKVVTLTCDLSGDFWTIGSTREYIITTDENVDGYYMTVDGINKTERTKYLPAEGGDAKFSISSYKLNPEGSKEKYGNLPWKFLGWSYESNGDRLKKSLPDWLTLTDAKGNAITEGSGSVTGEVVNIHVNAMQARGGVAHSAVLRGREAKGSVSEGAYDLSRHVYGTGKDCQTTTANCYVIDAPGKYSFPTVYGNAMKDGKVNAEAYGRKGRENDNFSQSDFRDHLDRTIVSPFIQYNTRLSKAVLLWQDVQDMVKNVRLSGVGDFVEFDIDRDHIDQGNAVIAVLDDKGRIAWSWHIWVTDEDLSKTTSMGNKYQAMPVNLGWKSTSTATAAPGRDIYLVFAQGENSEDMMTYQTTVRLSQKSSYKKDEGDNMKGSSPYYQWGRKDPLLGAVNGKSIPAYTYYGQSFYTESVTTWKVSEAAVITEKIFLFAATAAVGIATGVCTAGLSTTMVVAGWFSLNLGLSAGASAGINVGFAAMNELFTTTDTWGVTLGYSIQHPTADFKSAMTWTDCKEHDPYHELWGIGQNLEEDKKVAKTIYDPCPVGFHIPEGDAFDNVKNGSVNNGLTSGSLRLPACGARADYIHEAQTQGNFDYYLMEVGTAGAYWTARPSKEKGASEENSHDNEYYRSSEGAYRLLFGSKDSSGKTFNTKVEGSYEAWGFSVRPVKDY